MEFTVTCQNVFRDKRPVPQLSTRCRQCVPLSCTPVAPPLVRLCDLCCLPQHLHLITTSFCQIAFVFPVPLSVFAYLSAYLFVSCCYLLTTCEFLFCFFHPFSQVYSGVFVTSSSLPLLLGVCKIGFKSVTSAFSLYLFLYSHKCGWCKMRLWFHKAAEGFHPLGLILHMNTSYALNHVWRGMW